MTNGSGDSPNGLHHRPAQDDDALSRQSQGSPIIATPTFVTPDGSPQIEHQRQASGQQQQQQQQQQQDYCIKPENTDDAWAMPMVLSLDAGGVRGFWSLLVLEKLMHLVGRIERQKDSENRSSFEPCRYQNSTTHLRCDDDSHASRYLPCHYFDLIVGSSTGALSAIMLGRLRMTVSDCLDEYKKLAGRIFANPKLALGGMIPIFGGVKYEGEGASETFEGLCARRAASSSHCDNVLFKTPKGACKICIPMSSITVNSKGEPSEIFLPLRSYVLRQPSNNDEARRSPLLVELERICGDLQLWKVARAAVAASYIFREVRVRLRTGNVYLGDGGMMHLNSPVTLAFDEAQQLSRAQDTSDIGILVSIGTARRDHVRFLGAASDADGRRFRPTRRRNLFKMAKFLAGRSADPELPNKRLENSSQKHPKFPFFRFNNPDDTNHLPVVLDEWSPRSSKSGVPPGTHTMKKIRDNFEDWYSRTEVQRKLEDCAQRLVHVRRLRAQHRSRWERHAEVVSYTCREDACGTPKFKYRHQYEIHMDKHHHIRGDALEARLSYAREYWEYVSKDGATNWP